MRETISDVMGEAMLEDNIMDCGVDADGMDELEHSANHIHNSTPTIQDAAARLLTLLCDNKLDDEFLSSSEDEGFEIDLDCNDNDEDDNRSSDSRLLQQLATSLSEELKYTKIQSNDITLKNNTQCNRSIVVTNMDDANEKTQRMDITYTDDGYQILRGQSSIMGNKFGTIYHHSYQHEEKLKQKYQKIICRILDNQIIHSLDCDNIFISNKRYRTKEYHHNINEEMDETSEKCESPSLWSAGWDSCAAEAVRYLIDIEGLDPTNPTVLALKGHLEIQRNRALYSFTI